MSDSIQVIPDKIHIRTIRILDERITSGSTAQAYTVDAFEVHYSVRDEVSLSEKMFRIVLSTGVRAVDAGGKPVGIVGEYSIEYMFFVENLEDYLVHHNDNPDDVEIHEAIMHSLLSIAYSTSRGIVLSRTQGTILKGVIFPVLDTKTLLLSRQADQELRNAPGSK